MAADIFHMEKTEVLLELSKIESLVFVGGASEFIQGIKKELRDIDISVTNVENLKRIGYLFHVCDSFFYGLSGRRAVIKLKNVLIDIFLEDKLPEYKVIDGFKCETIESMIALRENTLKFNSDKFTEDNRKKIYENLIRLKQ